MAERLRSSDEEAIFQKHIVWMSADRAAQVITKGIRKNKPRIFIGTNAYFYKVIMRLDPMLWKNLLSRVWDC